MDATAAGLRSRHSSTKDHKQQEQQQNLVEEDSIMACHTAADATAVIGKQQQQQCAQQQPAPGAPQQPLSAAATQLAAVAAKPRFRGVMHSYACAAMLSAGAMLVAEAPTAGARWCAAVYVLAAAFQFFISGLYHTGHWQPATHKLLMRIDHSAIYALIAASYTPLVAIPLGHEPLVSRRLLLRVWVCALAGACKACLFPNGPRFLAAASYIALGWCAAPYFPVLAAVLDTHVVVLIVAGGVLYTIGALVYAARYPDPFPLVFGFHEVFHTFVVAATVCHFLACYHVVAKAGSSSGGSIASPAAMAGVADAWPGARELCWRWGVV